MPWCSANSSAVGASQVVKQLLHASFGGLVSLDFALPSTLLGVGDELVLAVESGSEPGGVVAGGEELRAGQHQVALARSLGRGAQAVAEFEFGLEEVGL